MRCTQLAIYLANCFVELSVTVLSPLIISSQLATYIHTFIAKTSICNMNASCCE